MSSNYRELNWRMRRLEMLRRVVGNQIVDGAGLQRGRLPILEYVKHHEGVSQREIADILHISPASVAVTIRRMERDGLVTRTDDAADQRVNRIHTTALGREKADECRRGFDESDSRMYTGFSEEELAQLLVFLDRLFENLSGEDHHDFPFFPMHIHKNHHKQCTKHRRDTND